MDKRKKSIVDLVPLVALLATLVAFVACSNDSVVAGTLIETNTGNKVLIETNTGHGTACLLFSVSGLGISEGDTLQISRTLRDTVGDTMFASTEYLEKVATEANIAAGHVSMDSVPAQDYDSLTILPAKGGARSFAIDLNAEEGETYHIDGEGKIANIVVEHLSGNSYFSEFLFVSVDDFGLKTGDSVQISGRKETLYGDTLVVNDCEFTVVADSPSVASGMLAGFFVPQGLYNKVTIISGGKKRNLALNFELYDDGDFYLDSTGAKSVGVSFESVHEGAASAYFSMEDSEGAKAGDTLQFSAPVSRKLKGDSVLVLTKFFEHELTEEDVAAKTVFLEGLPEGYYKGFAFKSRESSGGGSRTEFTLSKDKKVFVYSGGFEEVGDVTVSLPANFEDLSSADESFKDMPFPVRFEKSMNLPCLVDADGNEILLEKSYSDSLLYWGRMDQVIFAKDGTVKFDLLNNCNRFKDTVTLARYANHFDNLDETIVAERFSGTKNVLGGNALWMDSTDKWIIIDDFEPFTNDGTQMSASIWIKADSASQATPGRNYTRILSAKKDSVAFILQQRGNQAAVNLRLDARHDGKGVYNATYGSARILDGEWHNYSFTIRGDSVFTYVDGVILGKDQFENGGDFSTCTNPAVGGDSPNLVGGLDEVFFFDGSQSENWMRLFYALQAQAR